MGEELPDGTMQGYSKSCHKCGSDIKCNIQGDSPGHVCKPRNPEKHTCPTCGFTWQHGHDGSHNCAALLVADAKRWKSLMSSKRIRFIGCGNLGKHGQVLCVEFHADAPGDHDNNTAIKALDTYTHKMMTREIF